MMRLNMMKIDKTILRCNGCMETLGYVTKIVKIECYCPDCMFDMYPSGEIASIRKGWLKRRIREETVSEGFTT